MQKTKPIRSQKLTKAAENAPCIRCGKKGETRACHYNGPRQHVYGKGRGIKGHDIMTAEFCHKCDYLFTEGMRGDIWTDKWERSEEFLHWIAMTNIRRIERKIIKVEGMK